MGLESTALADAVRRLYAEVAAPGAGGIDLNVLPSASAPSTW